MSLQELDNAITYISNFYGVCKRTVIKYYWDEVLAYANLLNKGVINE